MSANNNVRLEKESPIAIYGAGARGYIYKDKLIYNGFSNILFFIDKNAENIQHNDNIPIYTIENIKLEGYKVEDIVIIISVTNVFSHFQIAYELYKNGFIKIIFRPNIVNSKSTELLNELYNSIACIDKSVKIEEMYFPKYSKDEFLIRYETGLKTRKTENYVTEMIPANILFGLTESFFNSVSMSTRKLSNLISDNSIFYFNISYDLMESFEKGVDFSYWDKYIDYYTTVRNDLMRKNENDTLDLEKHLADRYDIYQNMDKLFSLNDRFFFDNPAEVKWNSKGYFNIEDGNNRVSFLMLKGIYMIPCKLNKEDYNKWINVEKKEQLKLFLKKNNINEIYYPISHPEFYNFNYTDESFSRKKLYYIGRWLGKNEIDISNKTVIDIYSKNGYYGYWFARMRANVTFAEKNRNEYNLGLITSQLYHMNDSVKYLCNNLFDIKDTYDISVISNDVWENNDFDSTLKKIDLITRDIMITDIIWRSNKITKILEKSSFRKYKILGTLNIGKNIVQICIFLK